MMELQDSRRCFKIMFSRLETRLPACDGQTDRQTDRQRTRRQQGPRYAERRADKRYCQNRWTFPVIDIKCIVSLCKRIILILCTVSIFVTKSARVYSSPHLPGEGVDRVDSLTMGGSRQMAHLPPPPLYRPGYERHICVAVRGRG